jgi:hypothetical protein
MKERLGAQRTQQETQMTASSKLGELNILSGELEAVHDKKGQLAGYLLDGQVEWSSFGDSFFAEGLMTIDPTGCWVTEVVGKVRTRFSKYTKIAAEGTIFPSKTRHCELDRVKGKIEIHVSYLGRSEAEGNILMAGISEIQSVTSLHSDKSAKAYIRGHRCVAEQIDFTHEMFEPTKLVLTNKSGSAYLSMNGTKCWAPRIETFLCDNLEEGYTYAEEILLWGLEPQKEERIEYYSKNNYPDTSVTAKYVLGVRRGGWTERFYVDNEVHSGFFNRELWVSSDAPVETVN